VGKKGLPQGGGKTSWANGEREASNHKAQKSKEGGHPMVAKSKKGITMRGQGKRTTKRNSEPKEGKSRKKESHQRVGQTKTNLEYQSRGEGWTAEAKIATQVDDKEVWRKLGGRKGAIKRPKKGVLMTGRKAPEKERGKQRRKQGKRQPLIPQGEGGS